METACFSETLISTYMVPKPKTSSTWYMDIEEGCGFGIIWLGTAIREG
jgi:hypothetical protein